MGIVNRTEDERWALADRPLSFVFHPTGSQDTL